MSTPLPLQTRLGAAARFAANAATGSLASKPKLLLVDDEERILRSLAMLFRLQYDLRTTTDAFEALRIVEREPIHVIVSDQKMPLMRGADLLKQVKEKSPHTMRLLLTGYSELDAVVDSVNEGEIFRFLVRDPSADARHAAGISPRHRAFGCAADEPDRQLRLTNVGGPHPGGRRRPGGGAGDPGNCRAQSTRAVGALHR